MSSASSSRPRRSFRAFALLALLAAVPAACALDLNGAPNGTTSTSGGAGGAGGSDVTTTTATTTSTTASSSSTGTPVSCTLGDEESCYSGPAGTVGQGICKAGKRTCQSNLTFGPCVGDVVPAVENCAAAEDEDCNGSAAVCTGATKGGNGFGDADGNNDEAVFAMATDTAGNLWLGGVEKSTGNSYLGYTLYSGTAAVTKISPAGAIAWSSAVSTNGGHSVVRGVASDGAGGVIVVGEYQGTMTGSGWTFTASTDVDIFLIHLNAAGDVVWKKAFTGPDGQYAQAVAVDVNGNIVITGRSYGAVDFGGGSLLAMASGFCDVFVAKFDKTGKHLWSKVFGDSSNQVGTSVATTPEGDIVVAGSLVGVMDFGDGHSVTSAGGDDIFVAKLNGGTGKGLWANRYGDNSPQQANSVAVGSDGNIVVTGAMVGMVDFGNGSMKLNAHANADVFVAKLHADGTTAWAHNYGSDNENQAGLGVRIDAVQNILVVGYLKGTMAFGGTTLTDTALTTAADTDIFVAKLAADGTPVWARSWGDTADQAAWAVTTDAASNVFVGGGYRGTMNLPPTITATGAGYDAFWLKLAP